MNDIGAFFAEALKLTETLPEHIACPQLIRLLRPALNPLTIPKGRHTLYEQIGGLTVLGHWHPQSVWSRPHDHGRTWAIYAVIAGRTAMYEYQRSGDGVTLARSYWIEPGQAYWYPTGAIHSHKTYGDSKLIRVEGMNLWRKDNQAGGRRYRLL